MHILNSKATYFSVLLGSLLFVGCGGGGSSGPARNSGTGNIDLADYFPKKNISKTFSTIEGNNSGFISGGYEENIEVTTENNITTITTITGKDSEKVFIDDKNITQVSNDTNFSTYRHVNLGDTLYKLQKEYTHDINKSGYPYAKIINKVNFECTIDEQLKNFAKGEHRYNGDILKIKCINDGKIVVDIAPNLIAINPEAFKDINGTHDNYNISYSYIKKDVGDIANIDDDCILALKEPFLQDDRKKECVEKEYLYEYYIEPTN